MLTLKTEFARDLFQFQNPTKVRSELLNIAAIESLARLYEFEIVFLNLSPLDRFLLLSIIFAKLGCQSLAGWPVAMEWECVTHARKKLSKPSVYLQMGIPKATFHIIGAGSFKVLENCILASTAESAKQLVRPPARNSS
jgi:hypothetical protein